MYHIAICDDDRDFVLYLENLFRKRTRLCFTEIKFYVYHSGEELVKDLQQNIPYDLLVLDMQLTNMDGDETARAFRAYYPHTLLVFCSGVYLPTVKSFEVSAYRYLLKEYDEEKMIAELDNIAKEIQRSKLNPRIMIQYRNEYVTYPASDVLYVSIRKHGCNICIYDNSTQKSELYVSNKKIDEMYAELNHLHFCYAHNSYFVNLAYVVKYTNHEITLLDGTVLSVSRSKEKLFKDAFVKYLANKYE